MMRKIWKATLLAMVAVGFFTTVRSKKSEPALDNA